MLLMNSSDLLLEAQLAERRREMSALSRAAAVPRRHSRDLRRAVAVALAHIALHIDRRSIDAVVAHHPQAASRS